MFFQKRRWFKKCYKKWEMVICIDKTDRFLMFMNVSLPNGDLLDKSLWQR